MSSPAAARPAAREEKERVSRRLNRNVVLSMAGLALGVLSLYTWGLGRTLPLHYDEVYFAIHAHAIATTGHDANGRLLPVYFEATSGSWFQPAVVYFTALFLKVMPLSETTLRLPTVVVALLDVILIYFIGRRIFGRNAWAVAAGVGLMLTPAHVIFGRLGLSYLYPVLFLEAWLLALIVFLERPRPSMLFAATTCLGFGFFTYIAAVAMMPLYVVMTCLVLWTRFERPWKLTALALAGFAWPVLMSVPFNLAHPQVFFQKLGTYGPSGVGGHSLDPLQHVSELLNYNNLSYRVSLFSSFFNPGYLFMNGAGNPANSTRRDGVFLMPLAILIPVGMYYVLRHRRTIVTVIVLAGFLTAPLAASFVAESEATDRELEVLPFGVLLATFGLQYLWSAPLKIRVKPLVAPAAAAAFATAAVYGVWTLLHRGSMSSSAPWLAVAAVGAYAIARASDRTGLWRPIAAALALLGVLQFAGFYHGYLTEYPGRSAGWFMNNRRGAFEEIFSREDRRRPVQVFVSSNIQYADSYWTLYTAMLGREDLRSFFSGFDPSTTRIDDVPDRALLLMSTTAAADQAFASRRQLSTLKLIPEANGSPVFALLERRSE
jgi:4-amino-4-deoxy-L-arabinose transferase-like glycosyltransferase